MTATTGREAQILSLVPACEQAAHIAKRRHRLPQPHEELVSHAFIGAIEAVDRFDGARGELGGYAWTRIFGAVIDGVRKESGDSRVKSRPTHILSIDNRDDLAFPGLAPRVDALNRGEHGYSQVVADDLLARLPDMIRSVLDDRRRSHTVDRNVELFMRYVKRQMESPGHGEADSLAALAADYGITESRASQIVTLIRTRLRVLMDSEECAA